MTKKVAFVTGGTGFLGTNVIIELQEAGWEVLALRRSTSRTADLDKLGVKQLEGDVLNRASLEASMPEGVDAVFHVAADTSTWVGHNERQNKINIDGTRNVVEVAIEKKAGRFIHTSSVSAYGNVSGKLDEETPSVAMTDSVNYFRSKYLAEQVVKQAVDQGLDAVILNPAQIIGPYDYNYTPVIFSSIRSGSMVGYPRGVIACGHVRDYAKAHVAAYEKGRTGENYLLGGYHASFKESTAIVANLIGAKAPFFELPAIPMKLASFCMEKISIITKKEPLLTPEKVALMNYRMNIDSSKAEKELGFTTCSLEKMYADFYQWSQEEGMQL